MGSITRGGEVETLVIHAPEHRRNEEGDVFKGRTGIHSYAHTGARTQKSNIER